MFFVAKDKIGTTLGSQKEYAACGRRGISFTSSGNVWHYLWPAEMIEPSIRERFNPPAAAAPVTQDSGAAHGEDDHDFTQGGAAHGEPTHYLWSQEVAPGEVIGDPVINPFSGNGDWVAEAKAKYAEAMTQRAAVQ